MKSCFTKKYSSLPVSEHNHFLKTNKIHELQRWEMDKVEHTLEAKQANNSLNGPDRVPTLNKHIFNKCTEKAR